MAPEEPEPATSASDRKQILALDRSAAGIGYDEIFFYILVKVKLQYICN
jgi:hypothetical protein